jgi:hypothetical protein
VDKALYLPCPLPHAWADNPERCRAAGVPEAEITYHTKTKAELGLKLLRQARQWEHLAGRWVTADEDYGKVPTFRDALDGEGFWYVVEVQCATQVFEQSARTQVREWVGNGRPPTKTRLVSGEPRPMAVEVWAARLPDREWQELTVAGTDGGRN